LRLYIRTRIGASNSNGSLGAVYCRLLPNLDPDHRRGRVADNPLSMFSHSPTVSERPIFFRIKDTWLYNMFHAQLSSHEREIDFHVSLK
jgi:hypothetical protein